MINISRRFRVLLLYLLECNVIMCGGSEVKADYNSLLITDQPTSVQECIFFYEVFDEFEIKTSHILTTAFNSATGSSQNVYTKYSQPRARSE